MNIHSTHTKEQLVKVIRLLDIDVKYSNLIKKEIIDNLNDYIENNIDRKLPKNPLFFKNVKDIISYFAEPAKCIKKIITSKDKEKLIVLSRRLINFVSTGCDYDLNFFSDKEDLHYTILFICKYGGTISTCRRAINMINNTMPPDKKYEMDFDDETLKFLQEKEMKKYLATPKFHKKQKNITISFN